jgi:hypothetical protein
MTASEWHDFTVNEEAWLRCVAERLHRCGQGEEAIELKRLADRLAALRDDRNRAA